MALQDPPYPFTTLCLLLLRITTSPRMTTFSLEGYAFKLLFVNQDTSLYVRVVHHLADEYPSLDAT